jgi:hypothetical protein
MLNAAYADRDLDCQLALEIAVQQVIDQAMAVGWEREEALFALGNLAVNMLVGDWKKEQTGSAVAVTQH